MITATRGEASARQSLTSECGTVKLLDCECACGNNCCHSQSDDKEDKARVNLNSDAGNAVRLERLWGSCDFCRNSVAG